MAVGAGRTDFTLEVNAPIADVRVLSGPTAPRPPPADGELTWRIISHLSLNYLASSISRGWRRRDGLA